MVLRCLLVSLLMYSPLFLTRYNRILGYTIHGATSGRSQCAIVSHILPIHLCRLINFFCNSYMAGYTFLVAAMIIIFGIAQLSLTFGALRASRSLHHRLMDSILGTTLRWLDKTPMARILTRCTKDIASRKLFYQTAFTLRFDQCSVVDSAIPQNLSWLVELIVLIIVRFVVIILWTPVFGFLGVAILAIGGILGQFYIKAQVRY
jgi:ABC-type multidrug transport system fused ATPase/permease subunit